MNTLQEIWRILRSAAFWTVIFTGLLTLFTYWLYKVANDTNETSKSTQRAYVNFSNIGSSAKILSEDGKTWQSLQMIMNWANSGNTPARKAVTWVNYQPWPHELPKGFDFPDTGNEYKPISLGPREISGPLVVVPMKDFEDQRAGKSHLYFWGWVIYNDAFPNDPDRLTEFCMELTQITLVHSDKSITDPTNDISWGSGQARCKEHNCFDGDCPDYAAKIKSVRGTSAPKE